MSSGRGWIAISLLSGVLGVVIFVAIFMAYGGRVTVATQVTAEPSPGQPVDTPFIYAQPDQAAPAPATPAPTQAPSSADQSGTTSSSASENNAAPDISAAPNPFTAGIHT